MDPCSVHPFVSGLFHLLWCLCISSILLLNNIPWYIFTTLCLPVPPSMAMGVMMLWTQIHEPLFKSLLPVPWVSIQTRNCWVIWQHCLHGDTIVRSPQLSNFCTCFPVLLLLLCFTLFCFVCVITRGICGVLSPGGCHLWSGVSWWLSFAIPWWWVTLSIISCICWLLSLCFGEMPIQILCPVLISLLFNWINSIVWILTPYKTYGIFYRGERGDTETKCAWRAQNIC